MLKKGQKLGKRQVRREKKSYETHVLPRMTEILAWCRDGVLDKDIAKSLGIHYATLYGYMNKYPELASAMRTNKNLADVQVENSMFKLATGIDYTDEEVYTTEVVDKKGVKFTKTSTRSVKRFVPPNVAAQIFWLKNRKPERWADKQEIGGGLTLNYSAPEIKKDFPAPVLTLVGKKAAVNE